MKYICWLLLRLRLALWRAITGPFWANHKTVVLWCSVLGLWLSIWQTNGNSGRHMDPITIIWPRKGRQTKSAPYVERSQIVSESIYVGRYLPRGIDVGSDRAITRRMHEVVWYWREMLQYVGSICNKLENRTKPTYSNKFVRGRYAFWVQLQPATT